ncbi:hypothetical protein [Pelagibaculum spongiae]|uniref:hypothetical protein n=1 Tax=Pelagibaculum spongiae TaxID=2080658 RepID=UPI001057A29B|nr:hypothetical protein [Pelagibaculum spongiae]
MEEVIVEIDSFSQLKEAMKGKVFHVTSMESLLEIKKSGCFLNNLSENRSSWFGNTNGYFRNKGCISFFDYRKIDDCPEWLPGRCNPLDILRHDSMALLVIKPEAYLKLVVPGRRETSKERKMNLVPMIEVGIKSSLSLKLIECAYLVYKKSPATIK